MASDSPDPRDLIDAEQLRRRGSLKWTALPDVEIAAWVAESDFGTAPAVTAAVRAAVDGDAFGYLPPGERRALARACSTWYSDRYGFQIPLDWIHPIGDVREGLRIAIDRYSRPGSPVILPTPAYMPFVTAPGVWGRGVIQVPMPVDPTGRSTLDLDALDGAFRAGGNLLVLTNPHNPTGRVMTRPELLAVADVVERNSGRVFSDEIHAPVVYPGAVHVPYASISEAAAAHTVTATSASKAWNIAGLKCAQMLLSNPDDAAAWAPDDVLLTEGASTIGVIANAAAYARGRDWLDETVGYLDGNRDALQQVLTERAPLIGYRPPEGTYLAWLDLRAALEALGGPSGRNDGTTTFPALDGEARLSRWIRHRTGVAVTDGGDCGEAGVGFIRLNLAMPRPMVVEAGRRLAACLDPRR